MSTRYRLPAGVEQAWVALYVTGPGSLPENRAQTVMPVEKLLRFARGRAPHRYAVPDGERVYAIGDVHGRLDLLDRLIDIIDADDRARDPARTLIIFLGDLIDRGPNSRDVVERAMALHASARKTRFLMGNHEEVFLRAVKGDIRALRMLLRIGGDQTVFSYGIEKEEYRSLDFEALATALEARVPQAHVDFMSGFETSIELGDYFFVHAGIRPGVAIDAQSASDMRWIRDEFLRHRDDHGKVVVHGHTISEEVDERPNRIGIDTGAYATGRLTAIGLQREQRWFLST
jgi:serine/threonine protein phosphatase 1